MEIKIKVSEEIVLHARTRRVQVETYVEELLAQQMAANPSLSRSPLTPQQVRKWLNSVAQFSDKRPSLTASISREWIYQDHD